MPRQLRIEFAGAFYHVMCRGDRWEAIFQGDQDRARFLSTLEETIGRTGWRVHACVLMSNRYHVLVETPLHNLDRGMTWFQTAYLESLPMGDQRKPRSRKRCEPGRASG